MTTLIRNASSIAKEATFVDGEYVQDKNSYLLGLPPPDQSGASQAMMVKQLAHWERWIVPPMLDMMARDRIYAVGSFQWDLAVEQVRHYLRCNDIRAATAGATTLFETTPYRHYPDKATDWSAYINDECVVDSWVLAKVKHARRKDERKFDKRAEAAARKLPSSEL